MKLIFLRHGPTEWNETGRLQGRKDLPLSIKGREFVRQLRLPDEWLGLECATSPLCRAVETAKILGFPDPQPKDQLTEMDWGCFEGFTLARLRELHGAEMEENEALGLDFRPTGGESPRDVMTRIRKLTETWKELPRNRVIVAHKGVRRAVLALATGWNMQAKPPVKMPDDEALVIQAGPNSELTFQRMIPLR